MLKPIVTRLAITVTAATLTYAAAFSFWDKGHLHPDCPAPRALLADEEKCADNQDRDDCIAVFDPSDCTTKDWLETENLVISCRPPVFPEGPPPANTSCMLSTELVVCWEAGPCIVDPEDESCGRDEPNTVHRKALAKILPCGY
jgi:hypothetical protein